MSIERVDLKWRPEVAEVLEVLGPMPPGWRVVLVDCDSPAPAYGQVARVQLRFQDELIEARLFTHPSVGRSGARWNIWCGPSGATVWEALLQHVVNSEAELEREREAVARLRAAALQGVR